MNAADLKHRAVYRLTRDVKNPTPDRRRVRDFWALTEWKAGMLVLAFEDTRTNPRRPHWRLRTRKYYGDVCDTAEGGAFEALLDALEPERSLESVLYAARESQAIVTPEEILELLIEHEIINLATVEAAVVSLIERNNEDQELTAEASRPEETPPAPAAPTAPATIDANRTITVPMTKADAWVTLRALSVANGVPEEYDSHRDEMQPRTWVAERILRLVAPTGIEGTAKS